MIGLLVMADGLVLRGEGRGAAAVAVGELVFQTGMVGYQEALTDPSYAGQILIFSYPLVGNYGAGDFADQSAAIHTRGVIAREIMPSAGHRDSTGDLETLLRERGVPALSGVDTRFLVRHVRKHGVLPAALAVGEAASLPSEDALLSMARALDYDSGDYVSGCSTPELTWHAPASPEAPRVALLDLGVKNGILSRLQEAGAGVWLVPASWGASEVMALQPDAIVISNGPGDPTHLGHSIDVVRDLIGHFDVPVLGICLGHQLLALAAGGSTQKMAFGHRGLNQPVLDTATGRVTITTQNHGYVVTPDSVPADFRVTHTNLNDGTIEGIAHRSKPVMGVQWHPEASPGPSDTRGIIGQFLADAREKRLGVRG